MELYKDKAGNEVDVPKDVRDVLEQNGITPSPNPVADPIISNDDMQLLNKARRSVAQLQVEIKTVIGFASDYLAEKYKIKDQEQFNRLFGDF